MKKKTKNSIIKPLFIIFLYVPCMKIQEGHGPPPAPALQTPTII